MGNPQAHSKGLRVTFSWLVKPKTLTGEHPAPVPVGTSTGGHSLLINPDHHPESCACCLGCSDQVPSSSHRLFRWTGCDWAEAGMFFAADVQGRPHIRSVVTCGKDEVVVVLHVTGRGAHWAVPCRHLNLL